MTERKQDFVHLHVHSDMSQLDGCGKIPDYIAKAKEQGSNAIAFTEHGTMRGYYQHLLECQEQEMKPIYGIEFYMANDMHRKGLTQEERTEITKDLKRSEHKDAIKAYEEQHGIRDRYHLTVLAKNKQGMKNLFKLSSKGYIDGFYYKPRIDMDALIEHKEGLIVLTGCVSSWIYDRIAVGQRKRAIQEAERLREEFGDDLWIEVMPHELSEQVVANKFAIELREKWGNRPRLVATQDAHYVDPTDWQAHEVMLCIGTNDHMSNEDRFRFGDGELYLKTRQQMYADFMKHHGYMGKTHIKEALNNTMVIADLIESNIVEIDRFACLVPPVYVPGEHGGDTFKYIKELCINGWTWRQIPERAKMHAKRAGISEQEALKIYKARLKSELIAIKTQKFIDYFLLVRELYDWVRKQEIMCGPGRGSAAGSIVSFLLGITSVDPIEHGLLFERFISPSRIDMPDIDMDFEDVRRQEIIEHLRQKYGEGKVCQIATVGKLSGKQCLKDVSRVLEVPYAEVNAVTNSIIERSSGDERASMTITDSFKEFKVCREFDKRHPDVLKYASKLEGMAKNLGIHAAGVVTSPVPLEELVPLEVRKHDGRDVIVSAVDMYGVAAQGLLKLDVLGLRTLAVLNDCVRAIKERHGVEIDLESVDLNQPEVLQGFTDHDYVGIFQYDSPGADKICSGVKFEHFEDIAAMTALNRPGTARSGLATQYVARKKNPAERKKGFLHPKVSEITADTLGIIVYQEHVLRIFTEIAGFPPATADSLRKKIAKKWGDETIGKERQNFIEGAKKTIGMDEKTAGKLMDAITFFGCLRKDTLIATLDGPRAIKDINVGDIVLSCDDDIGFVENKVKNIWCTGRKNVKRILTDMGEVFATDEHWWLTPSGYVKTIDLDLGCELSYPMDMNFIGAENENMREMPGKGVLQMPLQQALPTGVQKEKDTARQSSGFKEQQIWEGDWERVEERLGQDPPISKSASKSHIWKRQSWMDGRSYCIIQEGQKVVARKTRLLYEVPGQTRPNPSSPKYESASHSSQEQEQEGQQVGEFGSFVPELSQQRALGRKVSGWLPRVISIEDAGEVETWDIECDGEPHNYVLDNGLICHNSYGFNKSHATAYGIIAYWGMYLKVHYPLEFYWALLKNEPTRIRIQTFAKDAKKHGIELLPPSVSVSKKHFAIDDKHKAIRGSLVDIKGVGENAAESIMETQPYTDLFDFLDKVERRKVHRGVVVALAKAGALDDMLPNSKWFIENIEDFWLKLGKKKSAEQAKKDLADSAKFDSYGPEERQLIAASVSPLAFGKHPIDAYADFMEKNVAVKIEAMSDEDFFKNNDGKGVYIAGVIVEVKYNQIGDFHTGDLPPEIERAKMFWGKRYANVNIEDVGGKQNRVKFDIDVFDDMREVIDAGVGTPVVAHAIPNKHYENLRGHFIVDLESYRKKVECWDELTVWECLIAGKHPARTYPWKATKLKSAEQVKKDRCDNSKFFSMKERAFCGIVTNVMLKYDKRNQEMAFFGMIDASDNYIDCICFGSNWTKQVKEVVKPGAMLQIVLDRQKDNRDKKKWQHIFNGGRIRVRTIQPHK